MLHRRQLRARWISNLETNLSEYREMANMSALDWKDKAMSPPSLLRLPFEIRLMIYEYLLCPSTQPSTGSGMSVANLIPDFHTYYSEDTNNDPFTLSVRTIDPWLGVQGSRTWRRRSTYYVRTGKFFLVCFNRRRIVSDLFISKRIDETRFISRRRMLGSLLTCMQGPFLTTTTPTTYRVLLSPYTAHLRHAIPSLLTLNKQIHAEASKILYSTYIFSFHTSIEAAVPFLSDLTPLARSHIRHLSLTKKALPYTKEFDRAEWDSLCEYIAAHQTASQTPASPNSDPDVGEMLGFCLRSLHLNIIAGKPDMGWDDITPITSNDFATMLRMRNEWGGGSLGGVDLEWAEQLMQVKGLSSLKVRALVEHCARPVSEKQAFWVAFSKSVEKGFGEWMKEVMV